MTGDCGRGRARLDGGGGGFARVAAERSRRSRPSSCRPRTLPPPPRRLPPLPPLLPVRWTPLQAAWRTGRSWHRRPPPRAGPTP